MSLSPAREEVEENEKKIHNESFLKLKKTFKKKYPDFDFEFKIITLNKTVKRFK